MKGLGVLVVLFVLTSFLGCKDKNETPELQKQNQDLTIQLVKSDSLSNVYRSTIKDIETVLDSILPADNTMDPTPAGRKLRTRFTQKVNEINGLLLEKEKKYNALNNRLNKSNNLVSEKSAMIEELNSEIMEKENVISNLTQTVKKHEKQIAEQSSQIESFIQEKQKLNEALETKTNTINSAHFIAGNEDELRNMAIIEKTGGFLETSTGTSLLTVTNPVEFWKNSKYLVITY